MVVIQNNRFMLAYNASKRLGQPLIDLQIMTSELPSLCVYLISGRKPFYALLLAHFYQRSLLITSRDFFFILAKGGQG